MSVSGRGGLRPKTTPARRLSAHDTHTTQTRITDESAAEQVRRKAGEQVHRANGLRESGRFLLICPPDTDIGELPELWDVYQDAREVSNGER